GRQPGQVGVSQRHGRGGGGAAGEPGLPDPVAEPHHGRAPRAARRRALRLLHRIHPGHAARARVRRRARARADRRRGRVTWLSEDIKRRIREEEWVRSYRDAAAELESAGKLPKAPVLLLGRSERALMLAGGVLCGGIIAAVTAFLDFFVFNWLL